MTGLQEIKNKTLILNVENLKINIAEVKWCQQSSGVNSRVVSTVEWCQQSSGVNSRVVSTKSAAPILLFGQSLRK